MKNASLSIPPLPSEKRSKPASLRRGKENSASSANVSIGSTGSFNDDIVSGLRNCKTAVSNSASSPCITTPMRSSRVLRYNESLEDFFCLSWSTTTEGSAASSVCSEEHKQLCEDIANDKDGAANDLKKWTIVLQVASDIVSRSKQCASSTMGEYSRWCMV